MRKFDRKETDVSIPHGCELVLVTETRTKRGPGPWDCEHVPCYPGAGDCGSYGEWEDVKGPASSVPAEDRARLAIVPPYSTFGDYDNSGNVERANVQCLREFSDVGVYVVHGGHGTEGICIPYGTWARTVCGACDGRGILTLADTLASLRDALDGNPDEHVPADPCARCARCAELREIVTGLEDYPSIDDDALSTLEMEREGEDWTSYGADDFRKSLETAYAERYSSAPYVGTRFEGRTLDASRMDDATAGELFRTLGGERDNDCDGSSIFRGLDVAAWIAANIDRVSVTVKRYPASGSDRAWYEIDVPHSVAVGDGRWTVTLSTEQREELWPGTPDGILVRRGCTFARALDGETVGALSNRRAGPLRGPRRYAVRAARVTASRAAHVRRRVAAINRQYPTEAACKRAGPVKCKAARQEIGRRYGKRDWFTCARNARECLDRVRAVPVQVTPSTEGGAK